MNYPNYLCKLKSSPRRFYYGHREYVNHYGIFVSQLLHSVRNLLYVTQIVQCNDFVIGCHARSKGLLCFESTFLFVAAVVGYCYRSFAMLFIFNIMFWYFTFRILKWFFKIIFQYFYVYTK
jgi:hypothetical protein